jgi:uncharacterized protein YbaR (Trm112 family)/2-polyprenyl-3-methyl-5-hydroxy-6-metoxy-1,4-benzoquinol methylase
MRKKYLTLLACPKCRGDLKIARIRHTDNQRIESGDLVCGRCGATYEIVGFIPRFVPTDNYATSFGLEWTKHRKTQYDTYTGLALSEQRFFEETKWDRNLRGERILEVGSGSGRFTEQAASTGALVVSMDYSDAVDVNHEMNGHRENVLVIQGDIYAMPFKRMIFDKLFCMGVLQHTPDPFRAFMSLLPYVRDGGNIVIDVYKRTMDVYLSLKYYVRRFTKNMAPERLYRLTRRYVNFLWPFCSLMRRIPKIGRMINWALLVADHSNRGLKGEILKEWAYLDTFDMLSPKYDHPQTLRKVNRWFLKAGLHDIEVQYGYNGIEGRGRVIRSVEHRGGVVS